MKTPETRESKFKEKKNSTRTYFKREQQEVPTLTMIFSIQTSLQVIRAGNSLSKTVTCNLRQSTKRTCKMAG
jgi:hypothetical protein